MRDDVADRLTAWFERMDARTGGWPGVLRSTMLRLNAVRAPEAAASLAYYAIFTLFPLLLLVMTSATSFLRQDVVYEAVVEWMSGLLPVVEDEFIRDTVSTLIVRSAPAGIIGLIALLWSASSFFAVLVQHISLAFPDARPGNLFRHRLLALLLVLAILLLFILSLVLSGAAGILRGASILTLFPTEPLWRVGALLLPWVFTLAMFAALYRWLPSYRAAWRATLAGALVATVAWQLAAAVFGWFVSGGLLNYELIYGSVAVFVALLFWIYISCFIMLFGAHLAGAFDASYRRKRAETPSV